MASLCLFLSSWLLVPVVHKVHALAADDSAGLLDPTPIHASASPHDAPCKSDDHGTTYPFEVDDAVVTGVASAEAQAAFDAGLPPPGWGTPGSPQHPQRSLLHGNRKPWKYSKCDRCMIVSCKNGKCSGHCKKSKKLFFCRGRRAKALADCVPPEPEDLPTLSVDSLGDYDSAIVTAPAPYIGCAEIEGKAATGCPERLTRASLPGGGRAVVLESKCMAERYLPGCPRPSPLYPYGICECRVVVKRPNSKLHIQRGPCDFTLLSGGTGTIAPPRFSRAAADEVMVESDGDVVTTGFVDYVEEGREPDFMHSRTVAVDGGDIDVKLEFFEVETRLVNRDDDYSVVEQEEDFAEEYDELYGEDPDAGGGDGDGDGSSGSPGGSSTSSSTSTSTSTSSASATARATVNGVSVRRSTSSSSKS